MYFSPSELSGKLGISLSDATTYGTMAQGIFDGLLGASLEVCTYTEKHKHPTTIENNLSAYGRYFYLKQKNPTVITTINGSAPGTYYLDGRGLWLETALTEPTNFPYLHTIVYTA